MKAVSLFQSLLVSAVLGALSITTFSARAAPLQAGVARVDLTPPLELKATLGGYGERMSKPATGVRDRVWAKALVLRQGDRRFALVTADVLAFPPAFKSAVTAALASEGWSPDTLLLLPSHTHTSIDMTALNPKSTFPIPQLGMFQAALYERTVAKLAEVIRAAAQERISITVGTTTVTLDGWNRNRRRNAAIDRDLTVTRIDAAAGEPLAVLVNWTAHPTFMGSEHMEFSGDWPGHLQRTLEALIGHRVTVLYFNGAEGDLSPTPRAEGAPAWEQAERYGRELALEAWRAWQRIKPEPEQTLAWRVERVTLPGRVAHPDFMKTGGLEYGLREDNIGVLLDQLFPTETQCLRLRLGDLVIAGVPGELTAALGLAVKAALRKQVGVNHVAIGGLANEWISYALAPEEYRRGGYEASVSFYGETLGPVLVEALTRGDRGP